MAMMAITTSNSINVKPSRRGARDMSIPPHQRNRNNMRTDGTHGRRWQSSSKPSAQGTTLTLAARSSAGMGMDDAMGGASQQRLISQERWKGYQQKIHLQQINT